MLVRGVLNNGTQIPYSAALMTDVYKNRNIILHGGDIAGFHSQILRFPDEHLTIISAINTAELSSTDLTQKSIAISDYYFSDQSTAIPNFRLYETASQGVGSSPSPVASFDSNLESFLFNRIHNNLTTKNDSQMPLAVPQISQQLAIEYLGTYYSEELDVYWTIEFDGKSSLLFKPMRVLPYLFSVISIAKINLQQENQPQ